MHAFDAQARLVLHIDRYGQSDGGWVKYDGYTIGHLLGREEMAMIEKTTYYLGDEEMLEAFVDYHYGYGNYDYRPHDERSAKIRRWTESCDIANKKIHSYRGRGGNCQWWNGCGERG